METFLFQSCYLVTDYKDTLKKCEQDPENYRATVYLNNFDLPQGSTMYAILIQIQNYLKSYVMIISIWNTVQWNKDALKGTTVPWTTCNLLFS